MLVLRSLAISVALVLHTLVLAHSVAAEPYAATVLQASGFNDTRAVGAANALQVGWGEAMPGDARALMWGGSSASAVNLHPPAYPRSIALGASGTCQVGWAGAGAGDHHAILWTGTAASAVDLHPASGYLSSIAWGASGTQQVGRGGALPNDVAHAMLWTGTAASAVDLHPPGAMSSEAYGVFDGRQIGHVDQRATLWSGTASSTVDLHPLSGYLRSFGKAITGAQQVGWGTTAVGDRALLWAGTAASAVDLHPGAAFDSSYAHGTNGTRQAGHGFSPALGTTHALAWSGSAGSFTDLHAFLPVAYSASWAFGVAPDGGIAGEALHAASGRRHAVLWTPVPEPASSPALVVLASLAATARRGRSSHAQRSASLVPVLGW